jgi:hypothetical protein
MAGRCFEHLCNGKAESSGAKEYIKEAHDALCRAFMKIEDKNGI